MEDSPLTARILIVEDEQITAEDLRDILTDLGYTITDVVPNGAAAIDRAEKNPPDMALMDIRIKGDMDGTKTAHILRERFNIPVVYLTAHADRATLERAKVAEPLGYIIKPFKQLELQASIEIALHKHREDLKANDREQVLSSTLRALGMGVLSVDREEAVTVLNATAETWTGWRAKEATGKPIEEVFALIDERTGKRVDSAIAPVLAGGKMEELRTGVYLLDRNGTKRPIEGSIAPIRDHHGEVSGAVIVFGERSGGKIPGYSAEPEPDEDGLGFGGFKMVAASPVMKQVVRFARRVAESEASTILLEGETGTGKDVLAHFMHHFGKRRDRPFVPLNCAAIPETLLEVSCLVTRRARLPTRVPPNRESSKSLPAGPSSWTRSERCQFWSRPRCCACWKSRPFDAWAACVTSRSIYGFSRPATAIWPTPWTRVSSGWIYTTG